MITCVLFLASKNEAIVQFSKLHKNTQSEKGDIISKIESDHDGKFNNKGFELFC